MNFDQAEQILNLATTTQTREDTDCWTIRAYLECLLTTLWKEGEGFSGKRPFGNSGWEHDLYIPLIQAGLVNGVLDEDEYVESFDDHEKADQLIEDTIKQLFKGRA